MKVLQYLIFLLISCVGYSQETFSDKEKEMFVEVYMDSKFIKDRRPEEAEVNQLLGDYGVSIARYSELFNKLLVGEEADLSNSEEKLIQEVLKRTSVLNASTKDRELSNCKRVGLDISTFESIKRKYKTDIKFQYSLKPFFSDYIKRKK